MSSLPGKAKQFLIVAAKLSVVAAAFYFIYSRLADNTAYSWELLFSKVQEKVTLPVVVLLLLLSFLNRFFEILKWQNLVSCFERISVSEASEQVLGALTVSIFTPGGIGEYGAKALFFAKDKAKTVVFLNLISNGVQMLISVVFGIFGLLYFNVSSRIITTTFVGILFLTLLLLIVLSFVIKRFSIKGWSIQKILRKVQNLPKAIHRKNAVLGICRYLIFSHQYYLLFVIFDVDVSYFLLMATIASVYFLASAIPTFQFFDFAVKGGIAVYFFGKLGVQEWIPLFVTTLMWLLNVVLPVSIGSYYVIRFRPQWKQ